MDPEFFNNVASLGLGGTMALIMFYVYRQQVKDSEERRVADAKEYAEQLRAYAAETKRLAEQVLALAETSTRTVAALEGTMKSATLVDKLADLEAKISRQQK